MTLLAFVRLQSINQSNYRVFSDQNVTAWGQRFVFFVGRFKKPSRVSIINGTGSYQYYAVEFKIIMLFFETRYYYSWMNRNEQRKQTIRRHGYKKMNISILLLSYNPVCVTLEVEKSYFPTRVHEKLLTDPFTEQRPIRVRTSAFFLSTSWSGHQCSFTPDTFFF